MSYYSDYSVVVELSENSYNSDSSKSLVVVQLSGYSFYSVKVELSDYSVEVEVSDYSDYSVEIKLPDY